MKSQTVVVVTGLSGAGKSTAVAALEDLGFFCVDNLPIPVVEPTLDALSSHGTERVALGIDVRVGAFPKWRQGSLTRSRDRGRELFLVPFLDAADEVLIRRFGSTRRPHPLSTLTTPGTEREATAVLDGIRIERVRLASLRSRASIIIDTSGLSIHELRRAVLGRFDFSVSTRSKLNTRVVSFGFKYGLPMDADLVLDVRFLPNPYFVDALRSKTGLDPAVRQFVLGNSEGQALLQHALGLVKFCLPHFEREGKGHVTIAVGCTGGRHRSVAVAKAIVDEIHRPPLWPADLIHRDLVKETQADMPETCDVTHLAAAEENP